MNPNATRGFQDVIESDDDSDTVPGPGHYTQTSTFKIEQRPERLQYFGSTVERFTEVQAKKRQSNALGPGHYDADPGRTFSKQVRHTNKQAKSATNIAFLSQEQRFNGQIAPPELAPGPGQYDNSTIIDNINKKPWGKNGVFGSTERRFVPFGGGSAATGQPGPGQYLQPGMMGDMPFHH